MGAPLAHEVLRVPGRLSFGCTDLSLVWPHGGTGIGDTRRVMLQRRITSYPITSEAYGGEPVEFLESGESWAIACLLRTVDDDALGFVFGNTSTGTVSQRKVVTAPGTVRAGNWMSARSNVVVFTPEGATHAKSATEPDVDAPFVVLHRAIPVLSESVEAPLEWDQEFAVRVVFNGIRNTSGKILSMGRRVDLTL